MEITKIRFAYFTPIMATRKVIYNVVSGMRSKLPTEQYNLTAVAEREKEHQYASNELLIAALPSYGGRIPQVDPPLLRNLHGNNTPAVVITTYGNRAYEDSLLEMQAILQEQGFVTVAGAAFITMHAISHKIVGAGRPDASDLAEARAFGASVNEKIASLTSDLSPIQLPGDTPFKPLMPKRGISPTTSSKCVLCMQCFRWCPTNAIQYNDPNITDTNKCVLCQGCVVRCPVEARTVENEGFKQIKAGLEANFASNRLTPEIFL